MATLPSKTQNLGYEKKTCQKHKKCWKEQSTSTDDFYKGHKGQKVQHDKDHKPFVKGKIHLQASLEKSTEENTFKSDESIFREVWFWSKSTSSGAM